MRRVESGIVRPGWEAEIEAQGLVYNRTDLPGGEVRSYWREGPFYDFSMDEIQHARGRGLPAVRDVRGRGRPRRRQRPVRPDAHPADGAAADPADLGVGAAEHLRAASTCATTARARRSCWSSTPTPRPAWSSPPSPSGTGTCSPGRAATSGTRCTTSSSPPGQRNLVKWERRTGVRPRVHLAWTSEEKSGEDRMTVAYLMDTVVQAGYEAIELIVEDIVLDDGDGLFYDPQGRHLDVVFKLYPWEWLLEDEFGPAVLADSARPGGTTWVEPVYKMLWSTKALLPVLWQLFGTDPALDRYLLPAYFADEVPHELALLRPQAAVGPRGRERGDRPADGELVEELPGRYGTEGYVLQEFAPLPNFAGVDGPHHPVLGAWVVDGEPAGLGIRESDGLITDNLSYFVPHTIDYQPPRAGRRRLT